MTESLELAHAPIIEAVVDINCDLPPGSDLSQMQERAKQLFSQCYPKARRQIAERHQFRAATENPPEGGVQQQVSGLQFLAEDEKQLVQIRPEGYSFNRLAPYGSLDDYLPEIERSWTVFRELMRPVRIRAIGLRFINRILLPTIDGRVELNDYLRAVPLLPDEATLELTGFVNQYSAFDLETENRVNIALVMEALAGDKLPIIFDIEAVDLRNRPAEDWHGVREAILALRRLKNRVFERTLTESCLNLFRLP
jgi:uncharacterized protein (TIGR04255 family)